MDGETGERESSIANNDGDDEEDTQAGFFPQMELGISEDCGTNESQSVSVMTLAIQEDRELDFDDDSDEDREFKSTAEWKALEEVVEKEVLADGVRKRINKRQKKTGYDRIIGALENRANTRGFEDEQLLKIWKVVSHPKCKLMCVQRRKMMYTMIPKQQVGKDVVLTVISWLAVAKSSGIKPSVVLNVYQLLNLYMEYFLVDPYIVINKNVVTEIVTTPTDNFAIPWKMELLRHVVCPSNFTHSHLDDLKSLLKTPGLRRTQQNDIILTLKSCKMMLGLSEGELKVEGSVRSLDLPGEVRPRFFSAFRRRLARTNSSSYGEAFRPHFLTKYVFEEFLPAEFSYSGDGQQQKTLLVQMLQLLGTDEGTIKLAHNPTLLRVFENWFQLILYHHYHPMSSFVQPNAQKYLFLFERCARIVDARQQGINVINEWVAKFLGMWDFQLFKKPILCFIPFLEPEQILPRKSMLFRSLSETFIYHGNEFIWDAFVSLFDMWLTNFERNHVGKRNEYKKGLLWLLELFKGFVLAVGSGSGFVVDRDPIMLTNKIVNFYKNVINRARYVEDPELKESFEKATPDELVYLITFSKHPESMDIMTDILNLMKEKGASSKPEDFDMKPLLVIGDALHGGINSVKGGLKPAEALQCVKQEQEEFSRKEEVRDFASIWAARYDAKYRMDGGNANETPSGVYTESSCVD